MLKSRNEQEDLFQKNKKNVIFNFIKEWVPSLAIAIFVTIIIRTFIFDLAMVPSGSMENTILIGDKIFINKLIDKDNLQYGDIVVFYPPNEDHDKKYVKRLIGVEGDKIEIKNQTLYINDTPIKEAFIKEPMEYTYGPIVVPEEKYFFLGDNRNNSYDSHMWENSFVPKSSIIGSVSFIFFPFNHFKKF